MHRLFRNYLFLGSLLLLLFPAGLMAQITLVGTHGNTTSGVVDVIRWNANLGTVQNTVATTAQAVTIGFSVFDAAHGHFYFHEPNGMQRVSFSPDLAEQLSVPFEIGNAEIDMSNGKIYGLNSTILVDSNGALIDFVVDFMEYSIADSSETVVVALPDVTGYVADASTYDSNHNVYYFLGLDSTQATFLYAIPTAAPSYTKTALTNPFFRPITMAYDNDNNLLYGLGQRLDSAGAVTNLQIQLIDPTTGASTLEVDFPQFTGLQLSSVTYDQGTHTLVMNVLDSITMSLYGYDTQSNTLIPLSQPLTNMNELEADNTEYAAVKYGAVGNMAPQSAAATSFAFPNPCTDRVNLRLPASFGQVNVAVFDAFGRQVLQTRDNAGAEIVLHVEALPAGAYFVRLASGRQVATGRFVVAGGR